MKIGDKLCSLVGMRFSEIGKLLQEASPLKDGIGLLVVLTEQEEEVFVSNFGMKVGLALCEVTADAVKATGGNPKIYYTYSDLTFRTSTAT